MVKDYNEFKESLCKEFVSVDDDSFHRSYKPYELLNCIAEDLMLASVAKKRGKVCSYTDVELDVIVEKSSNMRSNFPYIFHLSVKDRVEYHFAMAFLRTLVIAGVLKADIDNDKLVRMRERTLHEDISNRSFADNVFRLTMMLSEVKSTNVGRILTILLAGIFSVCDHYGINLDKYILIVLMGLRMEDEDLV